MTAEVGTQAPDFNLLDTDGNEFALSSLRGQKVVVAFFPAVFSGVCDDEMCTFRDALADYSAINASVVGITTDGRFANAEFKNKHGINFPILSDYKQSTIEDYDVAWPNFAGMDDYTAAHRSVFVDRQWWQYRLEMAVQRTDRPASFRRSANAGQNEQLVNVFEITALT